MDELFAWRATKDLDPILLREIYIPDIDYANGYGIRIMPLYQSIKFTQEIRFTYRIRK